MKSLSPTGAREQACVSPVKPSQTRSSPVEPTPTEYNRNTQEAARYRLSAAIGCSESRTLRKGSRPNARARTHTQQLSRIASDTWTRLAWLSLGRSNAWSPSLSSALVWSLAWSLGLGRSLSVCAHLHTYMHRCICMYRMHDVVCVYASTRRHTRTNIDKQTPRGVRGPPRAAPVPPPATAGVAGCQPTPLANPPWESPETSRGSKVPRGAKSQRAEGRGDAEPAEQRGRRELTPPLDRGRTLVRERPSAVPVKLGKQTANPRGGEPTARATRQTVIAREPADPLSPRPCGPPYSRPRGLRTASSRVLV